MPHSTRARPAPRHGGGFVGEPNPLLLRELRQALRLPRLPWQISAVVALVGLGMLSLGSVEASRGRPAQLGVGLFQTFISLLIVYVSLMGPAAAAGAIASEREGRTLEPLLLTGLTPRDVARGKFLAAYAAIALQVVAFLPLAAIPFLFGGVAASELIVAVVYVMIVAAVAVAFGLAVAARTQTLRGALAVSNILHAASLPVFFGMMMAIGESASRRKWPSIDVSGPIWWANAYTSVPFGLDYLLWLVLWPLTALGLSFWIFRSLAAAELSGPNDDKSSGSKRWFLGALVSVALVGFLTCFRVEMGNAIGAALVVQALIAMLLAVGVALFVAEPLAASRLVRARFERTQASFFTRFLGPGLLRGAVLQIVCAAFALALCWAGGVMGSQPGGLRNAIGSMSSTSGRSSVPTALAIVVLYTLTFQIFLVGFSSYLRTRRRTAAPAVSRAWTIAVGVIAVVIPWLVATILGSIDRTKDAFVFAAPSPAYAYFAFDHELRHVGTDFDHTLAALIAALVWGAIGLVMLGLAWDRARRAIATEERASRIAERRLDDEADEESDDDELEPPAAPPLPGAAS
jgi:ABC-type transport system involved in multi-copper enzyme maturation permease subunit